LRIPQGNQLEALKGAGKANTAYESTINGGFVLNGVLAMRMMLKLQIIIRRTL